MQAAIHLHPLAQPFTSSSFLLVRHAIHLDLHRCCYTTRMDTTPAHNNHDSLVPTLIVVSVITFVLATAFVAMRFYARGVLRRMLGWDDWIMLMAWIIMLACSIITCFQTKYGYGKHYWDIDVSGTYLPRIRLVLIHNITLVLGTGLIRISVCLTYLRLFVSRANTWFCRSAIACTAIMSITCVFLHIFPCRPISAIWFTVARSKCRGYLPTGPLITAIGTALNFAVFLWPARFLCGLKVPRAQRLEVLILFTCGCSVAVVDIVRIVYFATDYFHSDPQDHIFAYAWGYVFAALGSSLGIICGCLPSCKPALIKVCPCIFSRTAAASIPAIQLPSFVSPPAAVYKKPETSHGLSTDATTMSPPTMTATPAVAPRALLPPLDFHASMSLDSRFGSPRCPSPFPDQRGQQYGTNTIKDEWLFAGKMSGRPLPRRDRSEASLITMATRSQALKRDWSEGSLTI